MKSFMLSSRIFFGVKLCLQYDCIKNRDFVFTFIMYFFVKLHEMMNIVIRILVCYYFYNLTRILKN